MLAGPCGTCRSSSSGWLPFHAKHAKHRWSFWWQRSRTSSSCPESGSTACSEGASTACSESCGAYPPAACGSSGTPAGCSLAGIQDDWQPQGQGERPAGKQEELGYW